MDYDNGPWPEVWVPIIVDALREIDGQEMVRSSYFLVESNVPVPEWDLSSLRTASLDGPTALGLLGVLYGPVAPMNEPDQEGLFWKSKDLQGVLDFATERDGLSIEFESLWIPAAWFDPHNLYSNAQPADGPEPPAPGDVYRVALPVFQRCYLYTSDELSQDALLDTDATGMVRNSRIETEAFRSFTRGQIDALTAAFPNKALKLPHREART